RHSRNEYNRFRRKRYLRGRRESKLIKEIKIRKQEEETIKHKALSRTNYLFVISFWIPAFPHDMRSLAFACRSVAGMTEVGGHSHSLPQK
ncbi:MAG: hypothetical protein LBP40_05165, partial [Campylobacteraceae bacterium]|nr:hypothetical protein [Campylobacteraceae bacterium]